MQLVNSCPDAVPVYRKLGFDPTGPEQEVNGIKFMRMSPVFSACCVATPPGK
ncbi:GNAT family N-acetyltransferase [Dehalogenimonas etheniformans]|uniref:GNAT family N-acetyltransferase n=1 Tax=Dehalogenimonas etheniformans TaxID=1536648 RepID=UPI001D008A7D|nr:GNAT family N-acetyltransferase [Dehalogenimonas etheniformans]